MAATLAGRLTVPQCPTGPRTRVILIIGALALLYLALACRAAYLDRQVSAVDEQLQQSRLELWRLTHALDVQLAPDARGVAGGAADGASPAPPVDRIPCQALPPVKDSVIVRLAGHNGDAPLQAPEQRKIASKPGEH
jgi:hypothetical protein